VACGLALLASGQAFAAMYFSNGNIADGDLSSPTNWFDDGCPGTGSNVPTSISLTGAPGDRITICTGHSLELTTAVTLKATTLVFADGGTWGGSGGIKLSAGEKIIQNFTAGTLTIPSLDLSLMTAGDEIQMNGTASMIFTGVTGKSLECPSGTAYTGGTTPIPTMTTCTVVAGGGGGGAVSAPIFSIKGEVAIFSEEVK